MARCFVSLIGNIRSLRVGAAGLGGIREPMPRGAGCCGPGPSRTALAHPSCPAGWSARGCASRANAMQLPQPRVMARIAGKCPLVAMSSKWQVSGGCSSAFGLTGTAVSDLDAQRSSTK